MTNESERLMQENEPSFPLAKVMSAGHEYLLPTASSGGSRNLERGVHSVTSRAGKFFGMPRPLSVT